MDVEPPAPTGRQARVLRDGAADSPPPQTTVRVWNRGAVVELDPVGVDDGDAGAEPEIVVRAWSAACRAYMRDFAENRRAGRCRGRPGDLPGVGGQPGRRQRVPSARTRAPDVSTPSARRPRRRRRGVLVRRGLATRSSSAGGGREAVGVGHGVEREGVLGSTGDAEELWPRPGGDHQVRPA